MSKSDLVLKLQSLKYYGTFPTKELWNIYKKWKFKTFLKSLLMFSNVWHLLNFLDYN